MNKVVLISVLCFCLQYLNAQVDWFPIGSVRTYDVTTGEIFENYGLHTYEVIKDTIINDTIVKQIEYKDKRGRIEYIYFIQDNDKIYLYNYSSWGVIFNRVLVYDFSLKIGDTLFYNIVIQDIGEINIDNRLLRTQTINYANIEMLIIEGIGIIGDVNLINMYYCSPIIIQMGCGSAVDGNDYFFRCYRTNDFTYDPFDICLMNEVKEDVISESILYPNPALTSDKIVIQSQEKILQIKVFDLTGKLLKTEIPESNTFSLGYIFNKGMYLIEIKTHHSTAFKKLIIKE